MLVLHEVYGIFKRRDKVEYSNFLTVFLFLLYVLTEMGSKLFEHLHELSNIASAYVLTKKKEEDIFSILYDISYFQRLYRTF